MHRRPSLAEATVVRTALAFALLVVLVSPGALAATPASGPSNAAAAPAPAPAAAAPAQGAASAVGAPLGDSSARISAERTAINARYAEQASWPTPQTPEAFVRRLARTVAAMRRAHPRVLCQGMGISLPGRVDHDGRLVFAPNLRWRAVNLSPLIESACGLPVVLENAANACALGEFWFGRHPEGIRHMVAITVSEGIGVGLLINGELLHGGQAMAGEFGHVTLDEDGPPCPCGKRGCWERYASNSAAVQHYVHGPSSETGGGIPRFEDLLRFAAQGDGRARQSLERMARYLGFGLANLATALAPELIAVIGEVTAAWDWLGPIVLDSMQKQSLPHMTTRVVPTDPAAQPRLRGAVSLVLQRHFGTPHVA